MEGALPQDADPIAVVASAYDAIADNYIKFTSRIGSEDRERCVWDRPLRTIKSLSFNMR